MSDLRVNALLNGCLNFCCGLIALVLGSSFLTILGVGFTTIGGIQLAFACFASDGRLERLPPFWFSDVLRAWRTLREK